MKYRLEYSEAQKWLRMDRGNSPENTNGFITLHDNIDEDLANQFIDMAEDVMERENDYGAGKVLYMFKMFSIIISNQQYKEKSRKLVANCDK